MAEQDIAKMRLSLNHNIETSDVDVILDLTKAMKDLNAIKLDGVAKNLDILNKALKGFQGLNLQANLGKNISEIVNAANQMSEVKDIRPYSESLSAAFKVFSDATASFKGNTGRIPANLGKGITGLVEAANKLTEVRDIKPHTENLVESFEILSQATKHFENVNARIPINLGKGISGLVEAINSIDEVKDISMKADNLVTGFSVLGFVSRYFNKFEGKIPVNLGRGITGIVEAINSINEVQDISDVSDVLKANFETMSEAVEHFDGFKDTDYTGISRLISVMTNVSKVKKIDENVITNASLLANAINVLDTEVSADIPKLEAMNNLAKQLGVSFKGSSVGVNKFDGSLKLLNFELVIRQIRRLTNSLRVLMRQGYDTVAAFGEVENTLSFFGQSLGKEANRTASIIQTYADTGAIDFAQFSDQVAKLNQIYKGYGIGASQAAEMALSLTQLAYDASYALGENGKDIQLWFQRATSLSTGQARAGYFFGVDTSVQALREEFDELTSSSVKADKVTAALNATLENTREIQGQMAREYQNTYVQMDILRNRANLLKQSIGQALVPVFQTIIKYGQIAIAVVERLIDAIVRLFGGEGFKLINYADMIRDTAGATGGLSDATNDVADGLGNAVKQAKELKKTITGIDQVFTIDDRKDTSSGAGAIGGVGGVDWAGGYDWLAALENVNVLDEVHAKADKIMTAIKEGTPYVLAAGAAFATWKISKHFMDFLKWASGLKDVFGGLGLTKLTGFVGLGLLIGDLDKLRKAIKEFFEEPSLKKGADIVSAFFGSIGSTLTIFGQTTFGGALKVIQGLMDIVSGIKGMIDNGVNWDDAYRVLDGLTNVAIGIGLLKGEWAVVGAGLAMQGALRIIDELKNIKEAIDTGDWSGVDKMSLFVGTLQLLGPVVVALGNFNKIAKKEIPDVKGVELTTKTLSDTTGGISTKLKDLAGNLGWGLLIMAEVAAAALIFVGAIWLVGEGLQKIGEAWQPVIADGKNVSLAIVLGTGLLVGVGAAAWALGKATVGSGGTIPIAIAAGTAMLVLLGTATRKFIDELVKTGNQLTYELAPAMADLNVVLPDLTTNTRDFTKYMIEFAGHIVAYTASSAVSGISATIDTIVGWFTKDPIKKMADDAKKNGKQFTDLNKQLGITNPLVKKGGDLMLDYEKLLSQLKKNADKAASVGSPRAIGLDFEAFSKSLKTGFADLDSVRTQNVDNIMRALSSLDLNRFRGIGIDIVVAMELGINNYTFNFTNAINNIKNGLTFSTTSIGTKMASEVASGINNSSANVNSFTTKLKNSLTVSMTSYGRNMASDVVSGINNSSASLYTFTNRVASNLSFSSYYIGTNIAVGVQNGINGWYPNLTTFTNRLKAGMRVSFSIYSPSRWARDIIGENIALGVESGINETNLGFDPFKRNINDNLYDIIEDLDITPKINMPTIDTSLLNSDLASVSQKLTSRVQTQFDYTTDGTEKAVEGLTNATVDLLSRLISAVEEGKIIQVDGEKIGEISDDYIKGKAVRLNTVFGGR